MDFVRTLAKCRPECADDVWKICPKSVASLIVALRSGNKNMEVAVKCSPRILRLVSINSKLIGNHTAALRVVVEVTGTCTQMSR